MERIVPADQYDLDFWTAQFCEHLLFLHELLLDQQYRQEAQSLYQAWYNQAQAVPITYNCRLLNETYAFLSFLHDKILYLDAINQKASNSLTNKDFYDLVHHMMAEQTYFVRLFNDLMTVQDEVLFWGQETAEHLQLLASSLPDGQDKTELTKLADRFNYQLTVPEILQLVEEGQTWTSLLDDKLHRGQIELNDRMLEHEMREAQRGQQRLRQMFK